VWPAAPPTDPFLSRPMRTKLGLPPPERRVGLSAHDFAQAACAPEVVLVHSERRGGQPAVPSRWLWRLATLAKGADVALTERGDILAAARALDRPEGPPALAPRPAPTPPLTARPRELSVTRVETWVRDPYAIYARYVLGLKAMERPNEPVEARARGIAIHKAFERLAREHPVTLPDDVSERFQALLVEELVKAGAPTPQLAREQPLARNAARWAAELERRRRAGVKEIVIEREGRAVIDGPYGAFTVTARADRIELGATGHVIDFKTGRVPKEKEVRAGFAPQLTLTAAILKRGGFTDGARVEPGELVYVKITGRKVPGEEIILADAGESEAWAEKAWAGLQQHVARFDDAETPYVSRTAVQFLGDHGDYDHLARLWEWAVLGADDEQGAL
jgi:ATP-dependent helicase/nuclease subunit B